MTSTAAAASLDGVPVVGRVMSTNSNINSKGTETMATTTTTTKASKADKLAERYKRTIDRANDREAKAEADRIAAEKLAAAIEAEQAKKAEREAAEAAEAAEAERVDELVDKGREILAEVTEAEGVALVKNVARMWNVGDAIMSAGLSAKGFAERSMIRKAGDVAEQAGEDRAEAEQAEADRIVEAKAEVKAKAKAEGKSGQWQPRFLSEHTDAANIRKRYGTEAEAKAAAEAWSISTEPEHRSKSVRSFAKGESVGKGKGKGAPMSAKDAARLFAQAVAREGLTDEQAMDLIAEAMASVAE